MEIFKNKFLVKLIAAICLVLALFNFTASNRVYASGDDKVWGGVLINPIIDLMTAIGDTIMEILHTSVQSQDVSIIKIDGSQEWWEKVAGFLAVTAAILAAVAFIAVVVASAGGVAAATAALAGEVVKAAFVHAAANAVGGALVGGVVVGIVAGVAAKKAMIPNDIYLPSFSITAEQIFRNELALFDVNFFNPGEYYIEKLVDTPTEEVTSTGTSISNNGWWIVTTGGADGYDIIYTNLRRYIDELGVEKIMTVEEAKNLTVGFETMINKINEGLDDDNKIENTMQIKIYEPELTNNSQTVYGTCNSCTLPIITTYDVNNAYDFGIIKEGEENEYLYIILEYEQGGRTETHACGSSSNDMYERETLSYRLGADIPEEGYISDDYVTEKVSITSTAAQLQEVVSTWYFILRNFSLLVLMLLLIYSGIRIVIGSTAGEKAKYKERLMDWLVAICLIFVMHYIMVFAVEIVEKITDLVGKTVNGNMAYLELTPEQESSANEVLEGFNTIGDAKNKEGIAGKGAIAYFDEQGNSLGAENGVLIWPTDLAGLYRIQSQMTETGTTQWAGYSLCYVVLVLFTLFFAFTYARRVIYMAFLTIIAPLVAMTYPIDKITDGKAQAFDSWLKEYIFNLMIQPLHLLLYNILVTSAFALATESPIYALVAIGFMMPAEKLMRRFFGFEKAKTPGLLGGAAGAAIAMTGLQNLMKHKSHGGNSSNTKPKEQDNFKLKNRNSVNTYGAVADEKIAAGGSSSKNKQTTTAENAQKNSQSENAENPLKTKSASDLNIATSSESSSADTLDNEDEENRFRYLIDPEDEEFDYSGYEIAQPKVVDNTVAEESINEYEPAMFIMDDERAEQQARDEEKQREKEQRRQERKENRRRIMRATGVIASDVGRNVAANTLRGMHPMRLAGKIAAGATVGTAGLLLGVASGDPNKAFQYTTAGAMAGSALAGSLSGGKTTSDDLKDEVETEYYGEDYKQHKIEEQKKEFKKDKANIQFIRKATGKSEKEAKEILNTTGEKCFNNGITNIEEVMAIHQLTNGDNSISFDKAVAAREYAKKRLPSDTDKMTEKSIKQHKERWASEFKEYYAKKNKTISDEEANTQAEQAFNLAIRYNKAESGLTKI